MPQKLNTLDKSQLSQLVCTLVANDLVSQDAVESFLPAADLEPLLLDLQKAVNAIRKALPNSRFGSSADHYGFKRASRPPRRSL